MFPGLEMMAAGVILASASGADAAWCQASAPKIEVVPRMDPLQVDHSTSHLTLRNFATIEVSPYGPGAETVHQGLTRPNIGIRYDWQPGGTVRQAGAQNEVCLWYERIKIDLSLSPKIYVASEIPEGTCTYREVLAHEQKHLAVSRRVVNKYAKLIGQAVLSDITAKGWVAGPVPKEVQMETQEGLDRRLEGIVKSYFSALEKEHEAMQKQVDTLSEYQRVDAACPKDPPYIKQALEKAATAPR